MNEAGFHNRLSSPPTVQPTSMRCSQCGYDLSGATVGGNCPECGMEIMTSIRADSLPTSGKAVASLVLGICSIVLGCASYGLISIICAPLAVIFGYQAHNVAAAGRVSRSSHGMATAGLVTGLIGCLFALLGLFIVAIFFLSIFVAGV